MVANCRVISNFDEIANDKIDNEINGKTKKTKVKYETERIVFRISDVYKYFVKQNGDLVIKLTDGDHHYIPNKNNSNIQIINDLDAYFEKGEPIIRSPHLKIFQQ